MSRTIRCRSDTFGFVYIEDVPGFDPACEFPMVRGAPQGARLFKVVLEEVRRRKGIAVRLATAAGRLLRGRTGVTGVVAGGRCHSRALRRRARLWRASRATRRCKGSFGRSSRAQRGGAQQHRRRHPHGAGSRRWALAHVALPRFSASGIRTRVTRSG